MNWVAQHPDFSVDPDPLEEHDRLLEARDRHTPVAWRLDEAWASHELYPTAGRDVHPLPAHVNGAAPLTRPAPRPAEETREQTHRK